MLKMKTATARNSSMFSNYIRNVPIENDGIAVSLDATSLYTSIPIIYTLYVIRDYVNNDDQFTRKTAIPRDEFLTQLFLVLTTTWYTFNSQFYQQTNDASMGGPASSTTTEIYMQAYEQTAISRTLQQVQEQFVDDVYSIRKRTQQFFRHMSNLHQNIRFTVKNKSTGELTITACLCQTNKIHTKKQ